MHALFQGTVCSKHRLELMLYMLLVQRTLWNGVKVKNVIFWNNQFCSTEAGTLFACIWEIWSNVPFWQKPSQGAISSLKQQLLWPPYPLWIFNCIHDPLFMLCLAPPKFAVIKLRGGGSLVGSNVWWTWDGIWFTMRSTSSGLECQGSAGVGMMSLYRSRSQICLSLGGLDLQQDHTTSK